MSENKIKYGLKNVHVAKAEIASNGTATFDTPFAIPGAVALSLSPKGENTVFHADNIEYWVGNGNSGYDGDLEIARVPQQFEKEILGAIEDSKGILVEDLDAPIAHFALLFQFEGDITATKHVIYNCTCSRPQLDGKTKDESVDPQTEKLSFSAGSIYNAALQKNIVKSKTGKDADATTYAGWYSAVYQPTGSSAVTT